MASRRCRNSIMAVVAAGLLAAAGPAPAQPGNGSGAGHVQTLSGPVLPGAPGGMDLQTRILGGDAPVCRNPAGKTAALVAISGFKDAKGNIRVQLYSDRDEEFLEKRRKLQADGKVFRRIEVPTPGGDLVKVCVELPAPGRYTLVVLHDRNANGKLNAFSDGYGFSNNPQLGLSKPEAEAVAFEARAGLQQIDVVLNYWDSGRPRPLGQ